MTDFKPPVSATTPFTPVPQKTQNTRPQKSVLFQIVSLALKEQNKAAEQMNLRLEKLEQTADLQKDLLALKKELLGCEDGKLSQPAEKLIEKLKNKGIVFEARPDTEQIDTEIERLRLTVKNTYQSLEDIGRNKNAIFDITKKIMDMVNRLIEKMLSRMNPGH